MIMQRWMRTVSRRPGWVLAAVCLLALPSIWAASQLRLETDLFSLVPPNNSVVRDFRDTLERFGSLDVMLLAIELPAPGVDEEQTELRLEAALAYADLLAQEVRGLEGVRWLEYRADEIMAAAERLIPWAPMLMSDSGFDRFLATVHQPDGMDRAAAELVQAMRSPADLPRKRLRRLDPMGMVPGVLEKITGGESSIGFDSDLGYLIDEQKTLLLMALGPASPPADLPFSKNLMAGIRAAAERAEQSWIAQELGQPLANRPPKLLPAGGHVLAAEDGRLITRDLILGTGMTLTAVVLLFTVAYGRRSAFGVAFVPLLLGLIFTAGLAAVTLGSLNGVTAAFGALLLGLGIDFVIVFYGRYLEQRKAGADHLQALIVCGRHTVPSILLGAGTTAVTFLAFLVSDFAGLWQLGLLTGAGILVLAATVLVVVPALLSWVDKRPRSPQKKHRLRGFGTRALFLACLRHPRRALAFNVLASLILAGFAWQIRYDDDVLAMRSSKNIGAINQSLIVERFGLRLTPFIIRVDGADEAEALQRASALQQELAPLATDAGPLARIDGLATLFPSFETQRRRLTAINQAMEARGVDAQALRSELAAALARNGLRPSAFEPGLDNFAAALSLQGPVGLAELSAADDRPWTRRYGSFEPGAASVALYAYPPAGSRSRSAPVELRERVEAAGAVLTGPVLVSAELKRVVWSDALLAGAIGTLMVFLCLAWNLRGFGRALGALLPLLLGLVWMLGWMAMFDVPMNYLNVFVLTMILGIGVDYGIHLYHRHSENPDLTAAAGLAPAIGVAALTTVCGFGSLAGSFVPALRSMGLASIFGVLSVAWLTLTLLPSLLGLAARRRPS